MRRFDPQIAGAKQIQLKRRTSNRSFLRCIQKGRIVWDTSDQTEEITDAFPSHELQLDIALDATDVWQTLAFCAAKFSKINLTPARLSHQNGSQLLLRLPCTNSRDISKVKKCLQETDAPVVLSWTTTIGRIKSPLKQANHFPVAKSVNA